MTHFPEEVISGVVGSAPTHGWRPALTRWIGLLFLLCHAFAPVDAMAQDPGSDRVALIVGNAAYPTAPLSNPVRDADAVGEALKTLGFTVIDVRDASKADMEQAIAKVHEMLKGRSGVGMFYYAGHGLQLDWRNYLVPVDAKLGNARDVAKQTINLQTVLDAFDAAGNTMNIVVLDACRDNPFGATGRGAGLAPTDARWGTFVAFSTAPGNVAEDGGGTANSLYTQFLVQELKQPNSRIEDVFKRVRLQVRQRTEGRQIPWESTSLEDEFYFDKGLRRAAAMDDISREKAFEREKLEWDRISTSRNVDDLYAFLKKYPSGRISELAQSRVEQLQAAKIAAQPDRNGDGELSFVSRYRVGDRYDFVFTDGLTGLVRGRGSQLVKSVKEDRVDIVGSGMPDTSATRAGFVINDGSGAYDPPYPLFPGGVLRVGAKFDARSIRTTADGQRMWVDVEARVVAREKVRIPLGELDTYRIEIKMLRQNGVRLKLTLWFDPAWGSSVKLVSEWRSGQYAPEITIREMTARVQGP